MAFEKENGAIREGTFVIFHSGWSRFWQDRDKYRNNLKFPSVEESAAKLLIERNISGLGIDSFSADSGGENFPVHRIILGAGKYLVENIAGADSLPPSGAQVLIMPMKIKGGTESPVRLLGMV